MPDDAPWPRRPLLVSHTAAPGGSNNVVLAMLDRRPRGVEPACVFLAGGPVLSGVRERGVPVALVETGRARHLWRAPGAVRRLAGLVRAHEADVVFSHLAKAHLYAGPAARLAGVPALWWQQALPGQQELQHRVAERLGAAAIVCSSDFTAAMQRARTPRTPVVRIHLGSAPAPAAAERPDGAPLTVGSVGRLQRWKRVELLLSAVPHVLAAEPDVRFVVLGGGDPAVDPDYPEELQRRAQALGIADAVTFTGHVDDAGDRMAALDVLAHTARLEPFGLVITEALARGVPVVAPREGGPAEIVRDGVDGLLVDPEDADAVATAILALLRDPERRRRMGAAGRAQVSERFTEARMAEEAWRLAGRIAHGLPADPTGRPPAR
jgi:glycosyltransferase involved in cell wall biosynthesis